MSNDYQTFTKDHYTSIQTTNQKSEPAHAYNLRYNKRYLFFVFYIEQKLSGKIYVTVTELVDLVALNLEQLSLHFSDFSIILNEYTSALKNWRKPRHIITKGSLILA